MIVWWQLLKLKFGSQKARDHAACKLGYAGDVRAVDTLISAIRTRRQKWVSASVALKNISDEKAVAPLVRVLKESEDVDLPIKDALVNLGSASVGALAATLDPPAEHRTGVHFATSAAEIMVRIGDPSVEAFGRLIQNENCEIRTLAVSSLCKIGSPAAKSVLVASAHESIEDLAAIAANDPLLTCDSVAAYSLEKIFAVDAMVEMGEAALGAFGDLLSDSEPGVRAMAAIGLGGIGTERATSALFDAIGKQDIPHLDHALYKCREFAFEFLIPFLTDGDTSSRQWASHQINQIRLSPRKRHERLDSALVTALKDSDSLVRNYAIQSLVCPLRENGALDLLVSILLDEDEDFANRQEAAYTLHQNEWEPSDALHRAVFAALKGEFCNAEKEGVAAVEPLSLLLDHPKYQLQAIKALGNIEHVGAVDPLLSILGRLRQECLDTSSSRKPSQHEPRRADVMQAIVTSLGNLSRLPDDAAQDVRTKITSALVKALADTDRDVKRAAIISLAELAQNEASSPASLRPQITDSLATALVDSDHELGGVIANLLRDLNWEPRNGVQRITYAILVESHSDAVKAGRDAIEPLCSILTRKRWGSAAFAAKALRDIAEILGGETDTHAVDALTALTNLSPNSESRDEVSVRLSAVAALCRTRDCRAATPLVAAVRNDWNEIVNRALLDQISETLLAIGPSAVSSLLERDRRPTRSGYHHDRFHDWAKRSLIRIAETHDAAEPLIKALSHNSGDVFGEALRILGETKEKRAVPELVKRLRQGDRQAAYTLGKIGDPRALRPLLEALPILRDGGLSTLSQIETGREEIRGDYEADLRALSALAQKLCKRDGDQGSLRACIAEFFKTVLPHHYSRAYYEILVFRDVEYSTWTPDHGDSDHNEYGTEQYYPEKGYLLATFSGMNDRKLYLLESGKLFFIEVLEDSITRSPESTVRWERSHHVHNTEYREIIPEELLDLNFDLLDLLNQLASPLCDIISSLSDSSEGQCIGLFPLSVPEATVGDNSNRCPREPPQTCL